ncbi:MAG TPA: helix-turn-helix domain-containing protein [Solirubrobacterales bacterium]|nr:helix-turn-helix domain-containing protein [Solirubrobacterales bacterium]
MSVKATNWAWELGRDEVVKGGELLTLLRIADHADNSGICWPGEDSIASYTGQDGRTVRRHLKKLEGDDLLHRERQASETGRGRGRDRIHLHIDQPDKSTGKKLPVQPDIDDVPTGQIEPVQPDIDDTPIEGEPKTEPSGTVCRTSLAPADLPEAIEAPLRQAAEAKKGHLDPAAVRRACEACPGRDHGLEAEKFAAWHLHGNGENAPLRDVAVAFRNWLEKSPVSPPRSDGSGSVSPARRIPTEPVAETERATEAWKAAKQLLSQQMPPSTFQLWMEPLEVAGERVGRLVLVDTSDNGGIGKWVDRRYKPLILEATDAFDDLEIVDETQLELEEK